MNWFTDLFRREPRKGTHVKAMLLELDAEKARRQEALRKSAPYKLEPPARTRMQATSTQSSTTFEPVVITNDTLLRSPAPFIETRSGGGGDFGGGGSSSSWSDCSSDSSSSSCSSD